MHSVKHLHTLPSAFHPPSQVVLASNDELVRIGNEWQTYIHKRFGKQVRQGACLLAASRKAR